MLRSFVHSQTPTSAFKKPIIENELNFMTVNRNLLPVDSISIFIGKNEPQRIPVSQGKNSNVSKNSRILIPAFYLIDTGSGYYELTLSDQDIVNVEYDPIGSEIVVKPLRIGRVSCKRFSLSALRLIFFHLSISGQS